MDDPIKILFKFKNQNRRTQYHTYIFIGELAAKIMPILNKIKDRSFLDTLISTDIPISDIKKLEIQYGEHWYTKLFNTYHIAHTIDIIKKNQKHAKTLQGKYGTEWFNKHIELFTIENNIYYTYDQIVSEDRERKSIKKTIRTSDDEKEEDYRTVKAHSFAARTIVRPQGRQIESENKISEDKIIVNKDDTIYEKKEEHYINKRNEITKELFNSYLVENGNQSAGGDDDDDDEIYTTDDTSEDLDIEDLEKIYEDVYQDSNHMDTTALIKSAIDNDKAFKKEMNSLIPFDKSKDRNTHDEELKDVYEKYYVTGIYIYKDDTIKMIKQKICCAILNNDKFGKNSYLIPSRQYLFSEYIYKGMSEKVMLGQKWIQRNNILKIDADPNSMPYYEDLRGNLKNLKDNIKRYGSKIKWEDDDSNILCDYEGYFTNNEIYMIDIYNELGLKYSPDADALRNVSEVYINIYYRRIKNDDIKQILNYLNNTKNQEASKMASIYANANNDVILEKYVMNDVEIVKKNLNYTSLFQRNYITQSVIHVNLKLANPNSKINLFRVFSEFLMSAKYPFMQYQTQDGQVNFKYSESDINNFISKDKNIETLSKWFEKSPYGISFKVKIKENNENKFMDINLSDSGKIEYRTRWKESDMATLDNIVESYDHIRNLITKINEENNKVEFILPRDEEFKYAFINSIQRFSLPDNFIIDHNDLSDFSRLFFPYVSLVIDPRKRQSKNKNNSSKSKYGTYLRYKRIQKYDNQLRLEQRAVYFMKHYDYTDQSLANELCKQFSLTMEKALESLKKVKEKYPNIKKSRKILKKLENIPKYKPSGIGIEIQGKQPDRYKIRISGARDDPQLNRIIQFMNILIFMYMETYLMKIPERQILLEKLSKLTNIAQRRNKVETVNDISMEGKTVKTITSIDKKRLGFRPEKGQNQWTRSCQNSGTEKRRRPMLYTSLDQLLDDGYKLNDKTGIYEKTLKLKTKGKTREITIRAVGLESDEDVNGDGDVDIVGSSGKSPDGIIYYTCNPKNNGEHTFIGFLLRSNNPYGQSMPCCFKKDPFLSSNKGKKDLYLKSLGKVSDGNDIKQQTVGEQLYILQDTNKIQEGRLGILPKYLDQMLNQVLNNQRVLKQHHLIKTNGYYYKYGTKQDENHFLSAVAALYELSMTEIKNLMINMLEKDNNDMLFNAINNGYTRERFRTRENYITYIRNGKDLLFEDTNHILSIPGVINKNGVNIIVFNKTISIIKKTLDKEKFREDFTILCQNDEESQNIKSVTRDNIFLIKEDKFYYPIVKVVKNNDISKNVNVTKIFKLSTEPDNIVNHLSDFCLKSCRTTFISDISTENQAMTAKNIYTILQTKAKEYQVKYQVIDAKYKTKYFVTNGGLVVPTKPSGSVYNIPHRTSITLKSFKDTVDDLNNLNKVIGKEINVTPIGVYIDFAESKKNVDIYSVIAVVAQNNKDISIPVIKEEVTKTKLDELKLDIITKETFDKIDIEIAKGKSNIINDERINKIQNDKYFNESYQLFRLELSNILGTNANLKNSILKIIQSKKKSIQKIYDVREVLYKAIDSRLHKLYAENIYNNIDKNMVGGSIMKGGCIKVVTTIPQSEIVKYEVDNNRELCGAIVDKDKCGSVHCKWDHNKCCFLVTEIMLVKFINKISDELINNQLSASEVLNLDNYAVSDIVDYNIFTTRPNQKIIKSANTTLNKFLIELFGKDKMPQMGKRRFSKIVDEGKDLNLVNPIKDMGSYYVQKVMENNLSILRAYANCYNWIMNPISDKSIRNLKYYSKLQTDYASYFRSIIIDWLYDASNEQNIIDNLKNYFPKRTTFDMRKSIDEYISTFSRDVVTSSSGIIELYTINQIFGIKIIVFNEQNEILYIFNNKVEYDKFLNMTLPENVSDNLSKCITIKFALVSSYSAPTSVEAFYYKK